jgi:putative membrane protein
MSALLAVGWSWHPSVLIGFGLWTLAYVFATGPLAIRGRWGKRPAAWQQIAFHTGTLVGLIALVSPLDGLGDEYLFSAHMTQHLLLMFVTPPLWLIGTPGWLVDRMIPRALANLVNSVTRPLPAFLVFATIMTAWHAPGSYALAQGNEAVHIFEHLTYIGGALIGWWPVAGPRSRLAPRPAAPVAMLYLFLLAIPMTALSAVLTFSPYPLYSFYVSAPHVFGLSALEDQRLGGLLMWVPAHMVLFTALGITCLQWLGGNESLAADGAVAHSSSRS